MVEAKLAAARVATLFRFTRQIYAGAAAAGALLVLALWSSFPPGLLLAWFATLLGGMLLRLRVQRGFARAADRGEQPLAWERRFAIATLAIGAVWAFVPAALFPVASEPLQMVVLVVVAGVVMAGAGLYAASPRAVHAFVLPPMAAIVVTLVLQDGALHRMLAIAMVVFTFVTLRVAREIRRSLVDALRARLEQEALLDTLPVGVAFVSGREIQRCNRRLEQMLGYEPGELTGKSTRAWFRSEERWGAAGDEAYARMAAGAIMEGDARLLRKDGSSLWCRVLARAIDPASPQSSAMFTFADVDQRVAAERALRESEEKLRLAVDAAGLVYWEWDRDSGMITAEGRSHPWAEYLDRVHPDDRDRYLAAVEAAWKHDSTYAAEYRVLGREGKVQWISARGKVLRDAAGKVRRMIGAVQDISERRHREEMVRFLAYHDALTGLPNRRLLEDRLKQALFSAQRRKNSLAVLLIDLDDFKLVNDSSGHRTGDAVLREVAQRLVGCMRKADTLARHGGDEFVVVMGDIAGEADCQAVAEKILRALAPDVLVDDKAFRLGASIGIALYPGDSGETRDAEALLRNADAAMYRAKQLGRNHYRFYGGYAV